VMNKQREVVYGFRNEIIHATDVRDRLLDVMEEVVIQKIFDLTSNNHDPHDWNIRALADWVNLNFPLGMSEEEILQAAEAGDEEPVKGSAFDGLTPHQFAACQFIISKVRDAYKLKTEFETNKDALTAIERYTILTAIDKLWQEHLYSMDSLRTSISLRQYGQRDPLIEYKAEAFTLFETLMIDIKTEICHNIFRSASSLMAFENFMRNMPKRTEHLSSGAFGGAASASSGGAATAGAASDIVNEASEAVSKAKPIRTGPKVGRNDPCPCGSGKKYKQCCGKL